MINDLQAIINTLELVETHGEKNLDRILGCIQLLRKLINDINEKGDDTNDDH